MKKYEWIDEKGVTYWVDESPVGFYQGPYGAKIPERVASEMLRLANENAALKAEAERLKKALDQAVDAGGLDIVTVVKDKSYGMWRYEGVECIVGQSSTENFFASVTLPADMPELAAYLKETAPITNEGE